jgi:hypothetical protein
MTEGTRPPTDEEIAEQAVDFAKQIFALRGHGKGTEREMIRRQWVKYLQGLNKNARRTIARQAYWVEYERLELDG